MFLILVVGGKDIWNYDARVHILINRNMAVRGITVMASFEVVHHRCSVVYDFKHLDCIIGFFL